jgi:hypothetical protein
MLGDLDLIEFKNEVFNDTEIIRLTLSVVDNMMKIERQLILLKDSSYKDEFIIALYSDSKMWIDDNLLIIKEYLAKYEDSEIINKEKEETYSEIIESEVLTIKKVNWFKEHESSIVNIAFILITIIIAILGWTIFKK